MPASSARPGRVLLCAGIVVAAFLAGAPAAMADHDQKQPPALNWKACGDAPDVQCATYRAPLDYGRPRNGSTDLFVARSPATDPAHRQGVLFLNFGGPGGSMADILEANGADLFPALNARFDLIGMDPRGVGQSKPSIDCKADQETTGIYSEPFTTPFNLNAAALIAKDTRYIARCIALNGGILAHVSTANVARDMDGLRQALGEQKLNYFGFSYGTFLGATYASLFPRNYRALVLDGPIDANGYINRPMQDLSEQTAGFERALGRFFQACAGNQVACFGFGGSDPWDAFDRLIDQANAAPLPAAGYTPDPRPVKGDDVIAASLIPLYAKQLWPRLAQALAAAQGNDGSLLRQLTDEYFYARDPDTGTFDPGSDRYFTIGASEQRYARDIGLYLNAGDAAWGQFDHYSLNNGYVELNYGLWPIHDRDAYYGPFRASNASPTPLVVATTYDPATPYRGAQRLVRDLGNARLLTMRGDGHTAYGNGSPDCIDSAIENYVNTLALPAPSTSCTQNLPFAAPAQQRVQSLAAAPQIQQRLGLHARPIGN
jgi:pimeloyl-ACP methyl ester carboxylesterase